MSLPRSILAFLAAALALPPAAAAQVPLTFEVPKETAEFVLVAQQTACREAAGASEADLVALERLIRRILELQDQTVHRLVRDSAPGLAADRELARIRPEIARLEAQVGPLHVQRTNVHNAWKVYDDSIQAASRGDAPSGQPGRLEQIEAEMNDLDRAHAIQVGELAKIKDPDHWLEGRDDQIRHVLNENRTKWRVLRDERREILRRVHRARYDPNYNSLGQREERLRQQIDPLDERLKTLREQRDRHERTLKDMDLVAIRNLKELSETSGFVSQYMEPALDCIADRRRVLASTVPTPAPGAPPVEGGFAGSAVGQWTTRCTWTDPSIEPSSMGGTFRVAFEGSGMVSGTYVSGSGSYAVTGTIGTDGVADGRGEAPGWSVNWQGRFDQSTGVTIGNGGVNVTVTDFGGGNCTGGWSTP